MKISSWFGSRHKETNDPAIIIAGQRIPLEIIQKITEGFSFADLQNCSLLDKNWRHFLPASIFQKKRLELCKQLITPLNFTPNKASKKLLKEKEFLKAFNDLPLDIESFPCPIDPTKKLLESHTIFYIPEIFKNKLFNFEKISTLFFKNEQEILFSTECYDFLKKIEGHIKNNGWFAILKEPLIKNSKKQTFTEFAYKTKKPYEVCQGLELLLYAMLNPQTLPSPLFFGIHDAWLLLFENALWGEDYILRAIELPCNESYQFLVMIELKKFVE